MNANYIAGSYNDPSVALKASLWFAVLTKEL